MFANVLLVAVALLVAVGVVVVVVLVLCVCIVLVDTCSDSAQMNPHSWQLRRHPEGASSSKGSSSSTSSSTITNACSVFADFRTIMKERNISEWALGRSGCYD